jgi:toxin ParE1/3/4
VAKVVRTHLVDQQLAGIWRDIAGENEGAADRVLHRIDQRLRHLTEFPLMGPLREDIRPQARMLIEPPFLVLYDYHAEIGVVEIVAVVDGRRDLRDLF